VAQICTFLRYAHVTPIFGLRWTQLNGIITSPHHEVTLDNFGFLVGAQSIAWRAVIRPQMAKMVLLGAQMQFFCICDFELSGPSTLRRLLETNSGQKTNNQCKYALYQTGNLRTHMKTHSGEKQNQ